MLDFTKNNTKLEVKGFGELELKYISSGDWEEFLNIISKHKSSSGKEATQEIIYHQLIKPKISMDEFNRLSDSNLIMISRAFIEKHRDCEFKYFKDTGDFFKDFINAIKLTNEKRNEEIKRTLEPLIKSAQEILQSFNKDYGSVIQQAIGATSYINKSLLGISKIAEQFKEVQLKAAESLRPMIEAYQSSARIIESLRPQIDIWQKWVEQNKSIFNNVGKFWTDFQQGYKITEQKAATVLKRYKWFIAPSMPINIVFRIVKLAETKGRHDKQINGLFIGYFSRNNWHELEQMVISWRANPLLKKRMNILLDCVKILKKTKGRNINLTNIVLPTLIAQIDGFLTDYLKSKNIPWEVDYDDLNLKNKTKIGRKTQFKKYKSIMLDNQFDELANHVFLNILFQRSQKGKSLKTPFNFNRHKIMHGENIEYGRKDYLIRAFLVMDFLASLK
jgi:hypothetical protein